MSFHGDITQVTFNNSTAGLQGVFKPKANEGNTYDPGGFRNNDDTNGIAGNGELIVTKNRVVGFFSIMIENDNTSQRSAEIVKALAASSVATDFTFSCINGSVWSCSGIPVGDIQPDVNTGLFTLKVNTGNMVQIL